jgi:tetratricopeptide (TPR) repeat protein
MPRSNPSLSEFPVLEDTWLIGMSRLRAWIKEGDEPPQRPHLILIASSNTGLLCGTDILPENPTAAQVADTLFKAMKRPPREFGKKCRPRRIALEDATLVDPVEVLLKEAGLDTEVLAATFPDEFYEIVRELEDHLRGDEERIPAMLDAPGVTVELLQSVFDAAATFYRSAPWIQLSNDQVIAVRHPSEREFRYAVVMGQAGMEYGLVTYMDWSDVQDLSTNDENSLSGLLARTWNSLSYDTADHLPFADLDAIEEHKLDIATEDAYPVGMVVEKQGQVRRPTRKEWEWYEAALRVIPIVVREHLHPNSRGDYEPIDTEIEVKTKTGSINVGVKYPAGQLSIEDQPAERLGWDETDAEDDELPAFDRRGMEGFIYRSVGSLGAATENQNSDVSRAQEIMYAAWDEPNPAKRITLAHEALKLSGLCADAYVLLAQEEADTVKRALELYQQGASAGEKALGADYFEENAGHFWGLLETRPYMRARQGLANTLWRLKRYEEALQHYRELLRLNPNDNQGNRYALLALLIELERYDEARSLLEQYADEWSAVWLYSRALLEFQKHEASTGASKALKDAIKENPFVPAYLMGQKRVSNQQLDYYGWGDESEAVYYVSEHLNYWRRIPGAVEWLRTDMETQSQKKKSGRKSQSGTPRKRRGSSK